MSLIQCLHLCDEENHESRKYISVRRGVGINAGIFAHEVNMYDMGLRINDWAADNILDEHHHTVHNGTHLEVSHLWNEGEEVAELAQRQVLLQSQCETVAASRKPEGFTVMLHALDLLIVSLTYLKMPAREE